METGGEAPAAVDQRPVRSGRTFVLLAALVVGLWGAFLLVGSPRLMDRFGVGDTPPTFPPPSEPVVVALQQGDGWTATGRYDANGVCAEVVFAGGPTTRSCAEPEGLRPLWGLDVPETPVPLLVVGTAPDVSELRVTLDDGSERAVPALGARAMPAGFAIVQLPEGRTVATLTAIGLEEDVELVEALCGQEGADLGGIALDGPALLGGGCFVPRSDQ